MTAAAKPAAGAQQSRAVQRHTAQPAALSVQDEKRQQIFGAIDLYAGELAALAPRGVTKAHYVASLKLYFTQNEKLLDCTPASIAQGMLRVAQTGLELGVSCDLLPFKSTCQFSPRYNGLVELAIASGVRAINADVVREGDFFEWSKGTDNFLRHKREAKDSAPILYAYAVAEIKAGSFVIEVVPREHIEATRARYSKQWKEAKLETIPWYARKTAVRRLSPLLPKNARFAAALTFAEEVEEAEVTADFEIADPVPALGEGTAAAARPIAAVRGEEEMAGGDAADGEIYDERVSVRERITQRAPDSTTASTSTAHLASEEQTERLLDLIAHVSIPKEVKEKVEARMKTGLPQHIAATWIEALSQRVRQHAPAAAAADDADTLGL